MTIHCFIENHTVHLWSVFIPHFVADEHILISILNADEVLRANRLVSTLNRQRFIIARAFLRKILSQYTGIPPEMLNFAYGPKGKPYLAENKLDLYFNLSHSHDFAVYALTVQQEIGIDIEKIEPDFKEGIAKRFFEPEEYQELMQLSPMLRSLTFYRLWARKEATSKALGEGLYTSPTLEQKDQPIYIENIPINPHYQCALATFSPIQKRMNWQWTATGIIPHEV